MKIEFQEGELVDLVKFLLFFVATDNYESHAVANPLLTEDVMTNMFSYIHTLIEAEGKEGSVDPKDELYYINTYKKVSDLLFYLKRNYNWEDSDYINQMKFKSILEAVEFYKKEVFKISKLRREGFGKDKDKEDEKEPTNVISLIPSSKE